MGFYQEGLFWFVSGVVRVELLNIMERDAVLVCKGEGFAIRWSSISRSSFTIKTGSSIGD